MYHNDILHQLAQRIKDVIPTEITLAQIYSNLTPPPNLQMGDFAFPCFSLAKALKKSPAQIADQLAPLIKPDHFILSVQPQGPYLNFVVSSEIIGEKVIKQILDGEFFTKQIFSTTPKTMLEYSQPNTHKEIHVGHMRNLCLGNALVRLFKYSGHQVIASTYPGDVGTHVAKCLWYLEHRNTNPIPTQNRGAWLGTIYTKATNQLEQEKGTDKETENKQILTDILKSIERQQGPYFERWQETRQWSIDLMKQLYQWADVEFDRWYFESEVDTESLKLAQKYFKQGLYIESEGAIGMDLANENLGFCIMIKSDGTGMYATKDIALAHKKFEEYQLDQNIYIVDKRQAFHFKQVFKVLEKLGFTHYKDCLHLEYDFVELPDGAMSSRKGNIIPMTDLINKMEETVKTNYLNRYQDQWPAEEINSVAKMIAGGAIKYGMLKMDSNRKIVFEMNDWLKLEGETGPYLQYVYARINSLCQKLNYDSLATVDWTILGHSSEKALLLKLSYFNDIIETAVRNFRPYQLCNYLYELGKLFNNFYVECPIGKAENESLKNTRLALAKACGITMKKGLGLLGIETPARM